MMYEVTIDGREFCVELLPGKNENEWVCHLPDLKAGSREFKLNSIAAEHDVLSLLFDGRSYEIKRNRTPAATQLMVGNRRFVIEVRDPRSLRGRRSAAADHDGPHKLTAPMPGKVVRILAPEGTDVEAGQGIIVMEAMKMQNELKSPKKGVVQKVFVVEGAAANAGDVLAVIG